MGSLIVGGLLWFLIYWVLRSAGRKRPTKNTGARSSTPAPRVTRTNSAKWEQDAPYPECFDDHDLYDDLEDDL